MDSESVWWKNLISFRPVFVDVLSPVLPGASADESTAGGFRVVGMAGLLNDLHSDARADAGRPSGD